jgi:1,4-alpha-glucan branching enzyme
MSHVDKETLRRAPDPQAESTFLSSKLHWEGLNDQFHANQLDWYRRVLAARRERILPLLDRIEPRGTRLVHSGGQFECEWSVKEMGRLRLQANLCATPSKGFTPASLGEVLWLEGSQPDIATLGPWSVRWSLEPAE